jgi:hypothetical protein
MSVATLLVKLGLPFEHFLMVSTLHPDAAFLAFVQGDLNVNDYHRKMKGMIDTLFDLATLVS